MSDVPSASASGSVEDGAPDAKKPRAEEPGNSQLGLETTTDVGPRSFNSSRDGARKGTLALNITDWEAFKRSTDKVYSESLHLAGIEWKAETFVRNQSIGVWLRAIGYGQEAKWYRKVEFAVRWPHQPRHDYQRHNVVFFAGGPPAGWNELRTLDVSSTFLES
ncbi:hypothetical protein AAVH_21193 [Aphelenchoides avenae]|nr:hypothetical protein AAVH_21192 [Aphelenchus avenae]KAH7711502.1 hypothetical protein AAVH_21193 [Aphelenchus avenae]